MTKFDYDLPAFTTITGSNDGGFSAREMATDIIQTAEYAGTLLPAAWRELAQTDDDDVDPNDYLDLLEPLSISPSCSITWQDNELLVLPYIDDEIPRFTDYPDGFQPDGEVIYVVNDHGNVTCQAWNGKAYETVWDMV